MRESVGLKQKTQSASGLAFCRGEQKGARQFCGYRITTQKRASKGRTPGGGERDRKCEKKKEKSVQQTKPQRRHWLTRRANGSVYRKGETCDYGMRHFSETYIANREASTVMSGGRALKQILCIRRI